MQWIATVSRLLVAEHIVFMPRKYCVDGLGVSGDMSYLSFGFVRYSTAGLECTPMSVNIP